MTTHQRARESVARLGSGASAAPGSEVLPAGPVMEAGGERPTATGFESRSRPAADDGLLGIVVVNYASHGLVERNLGSIDLRLRQVRVVLVDNYSSATEREAAAAL